METEYLNPFVDGVRELMSTMLQSSCDVATDRGDSIADVSGVIRLDWTTHLQVALSFPRETATRMVSHLLAIEPTEIDDDILGDGVGELTNIVAGMAKSRIGHTAGPIALSIPEVVVSDGHELTLFRTDDVAHFRMTTELGEFSLRICHTPVH